MSDLKPCPFCGPGTELKAYRHGPDEPDCYVQCDGCTTCGPSAKTEPLAEEAWNRRTQPEATAPAPELMGYWYWDEGGLRDAPDWRMGGIKRPPADWPKNKRLNLYAGAPAQDLSAAILGIRFNADYSDPKLQSAFDRGCDEALVAAAALASSANALSAGGRVDAITDTQRIDHIEAWSTSNKVRGMHWNTFCFDVDSTVREQLDAAILQSQKSGSHG